MLQPQIVEKPALRVIGLEAAFIHALSPDATNFKVIGPLWDKFIKRASEVPDRIGDAMFGVIYGRPESERSHPHELQYIAGVSVSSAAAIPEGMVSRTVLAGTFAVFVHCGPIKTIGNTVHEIYRVWLPQSGYQHGENADVELYDRRFCVDGADSEMEYWLSVTERAITS
ncbi:MAG: GyrI-like domain-containing protein [Gemmataceae bacterium]|nr:GyrI-like domain-containing protein [Gemmataceae bacterium]